MPTQRYCSILDVQFEINRHEIRREDKEKLAVVGTFLRKYTDTTAVIEGHTDNVGYCRPQHDSVRVQGGERGRLPGTSTIRSPRLA